VNSPRPRRRLVLATALAATALAASAAVAVAWNWKRIRMAFAVECIVRGSCDRPHSWNEHDLRVYQRHHPDHYLPHRRTCPEDALLALAELACEDSTLLERYLEDERESQLGVIRMGRVPGMPTVGATAKAILRHLPELKESR
jgi:hypothetical protein